jgi:gas vesicle protein
MSKLLGVIVSLGVGAGAAYMLDPERGRHRRTLVRDKAMAATNRMRDALDGKTRHWSNLARGYMAEARGLFARGRRTAQNASARIEGRA